MLSMKNDYLIELIQKIINCEGEENQIDKWIEELEIETRNPEVSDLIFWNDEQLSSKELLEKAMKSKVIEL